ncbi:hypothetical protein QTP70_005175 [Hemibagrus guttatus]|uniref:C-type lectin domain-containing protein n=1 Tax=Hemibagrus guttatus TaxID=175788 RepID=A0AAE0R9C1_9TELE|nr:hypothetical protein QTP70_005175 [Hemibagrus guttatus]
MAVVVNPGLDRSDRGDDFHMLPLQEFESLKRNPQVRPRVMGGQFLILVKEKKTWKEAEEFCDFHYTGLASVTSKWTLQQLTLESAGTETESVWTGLHFVNGQWLWMSEEQTWSQTLFWVQIPAQSPAQCLASMPSCPALSYRCGALNTNTKTFQSQNCNEKLNFICYWT